MQAFHAALLAPTSDSGSGSSSNRGRGGNGCVRVHIDAAAATTGVTRFGQERERPSTHVRARDTADWKSGKNADTGINTGTGAGTGTGADSDRHGPCVSLYSKDEAVCDLRRFDFLITADPHGGCSGHMRDAHFETVQTISSFDGRMRVLDYFPPRDDGGLVARVYSGGVELASALRHGGLDALIHRAPAMYVMRRRLGEGQGEKRGAKEGRERREGKRDKKKEKRDKTGRG